MDTPKKADPVMQDTVCPNCRYRFKIVKRIEPTKTMNINNDRTTKKDIQ